MQPNYLGNPRVVETVLAEMLNNVFLRWEKGDSDRNSTVTASVDSESRAKDDDEPPEPEDEERNDDSKSLL